MVWLTCPYLGAPVELTDERALHVETNHPELLPHGMHFLEATVVDPDTVAEKSGRRELAFIRRWAEPLQGRSVVVVVVPGRDVAGGTLRYWVVTAYIARRTSTWRPVWERT